MTDPIAFLPCCGAIIHLTRTGTNTWRGEETHNEHCKETT